MSTLNSLALAITVATRRRDQAQSQLMAAERAYRLAENQLSQLQTYAAETAARWATGAVSVTSVGMLQHHYQFMDCLQHAAQLQEGVLADLSQRLDVVKASYQAAEIRLAGLQKIMEKKQADLTLVQMRREQKEMDEFAALQYRRAALAMENQHEC